MLAIAASRLRVRRRARRRVVVAQAIALCDRTQRSAAADVDGVGVVAAEVDRVEVAAAEVDKVEGAAAKIDGVQGACGSSDTGWRGRRVSECRVVRSHSCLF